jgi:hypothetical protein
MFSEIKLREELARYLRGDVSQDDFEDWFSRESWNIHRSPDFGAQRLAYAIELKLAENDRGHLPDAELMAEFKELLRSPIFVDLHGVEVVTGSSTSEVTPHSLAFQLVDKSPVGASW